MKVYDTPEAHKPLFYVLKDERRLGVTRHTLHRYVERIRPALEGNREALKIDIQRMVRECAVWGKPPTWLKSDEISGQSEFLLIGDDICMPVFNGLITTVMHRGSYTTTYKEHRREHRRRRALSRKLAKQSGNKANSAGRATQPDLRRSSGRKPMREING